MGTIAKGEDLHDYMAKMVKENDIKAGHITIIGALSQANVGYLNYATGQYEYSKYRRPMTIAACTGTVLRDDNDEPLVHLHISLSDHDGEMFGGHLIEECTVISAEFTIQVFE